MCSRGHGCSALQRKSRMITLYSGQPQTGLLSAPAEESCNHSLPRAVPDMAAMRLTRRGWTDHSIPWSPSERDAKPSSAGVIQSLHSVGSREGCKALQQKGCAITSFPQNLRHGY